VRSDAQLKRDVEDELEWDPAVDAAHVGVTVEDGVVTLSGHLKTHAEKHAAQQAARRVQGVRALAVELDVRPPHGPPHTDAEIAHAIRESLRWRAQVPADRITVKVEKGWVTLTGTVDWHHQRHEAERSVRGLAGVVGVTDLLALAPRAVPADVALRIQEALLRQARREAKRIDVTVEGSTVTLRGEVHSLAERVAAHGAAWSAPGITRVVDDLRVRG